MTNKQNRVSERMLLTWFVLAGLILFFTPQSLTNKFHFAFVRLFRGPLSMSRNFTLSAQTHRSLTDVVSQNRYMRLRNHLANTTQWLQQERQKVEKLSGLRDRAAWKGVNFVLADVITASMDESRSELIINRGETDGLDKGQFVLGNHSVIGTISDVGPRIAQVKLITDPTSEIAVKTGELNVGMVLQGNGNNSAKVKLLPIKHKIRIGDIVCARKKPGFLDIPMIVGTVAQCRRDDENPLLWDVKVEPACDIEKLTDVTVIIMNSQESLRM